MLGFMFLIGLFLLAFTVFAQTRERDQPPGENLVKLFTLTQHGKMDVECSCAPGNYLVCTSAWMIQTDGEDKPNPVMGQGLQVVPEGCDSTGGFNLP